MAIVVNQEYEPAVAIDRIHEHPRNTRRGDMEKIKESIAVNGFYGAVHVQRSTGYVVAGNHRFRAAKELGLADVPVIWLDVDDTEAKRILLVDNRSGDLATYDTQSLYRELQEMETLEGTGYNQDDLDDMFVKMQSELGTVTDGMTPEERLADYEESGIRAIVLPFSMADHARVTAGLETLREQLGVDSYSDVVLRLVAEAV